MPAQHDPPVDPPEPEVTVIGDLRIGQAAMNPASPTTIDPIASGPFGGVLQEWAEVVVKPDTSENRLQAGLEGRLPFGSSITTHWNGPAEQVVLWFAIVSEIIAGGVWILAGWTAGLGLELMALITLIAWIVWGKPTDDDEKYQ